MIKNKKILITGGFGFIGSHLIEKFIDHNQITVLDNFRRNSSIFLPKKLLENVRAIKGDVFDFDTVKKAVKGQEILMHLAAIAGASSYAKDPLLTINVNLMGSYNILKSSLQHNVSLTLLFSTSEVYGTRAINVKESDPTVIGPLFEPRWSYAISKLASDHLAMAYFKKERLPVCIVRPFNVFGPRQLGEGAITDIIKSSMQAGEIIVSGDGTQKRSWCYIDDFTNAIESIIVRRTIGECFNIGNPQNNISILALAKLIKARTSHARITFSSEKEVEILYRVPNITRAFKILGWKPKVKIKDGLDETINWFKMNQNFL